MKELLNCIGLALPWVGLPLLVIVLVLAVWLFIDLLKGLSAPEIGCWEYAYDSSQGLQAWRVRWSIPDSHGKYLYVCSFYTEHFARHEAADMNRLGWKIEWTSGGIL